MTGLQIMMLCAALVCIACAVGFIYIAKKMFASEETDDEIDKK
jgi:hypothetical protein